MCRPILIPMVLSCIWGMSMRADCGRVVGANLEPAVGPLRKHVQALLSAVSSVSAVSSAMHL